MQRLIEHPGLSDDASSNELKTLCAGLLGDTDFATLSFGTEAGLYQSIGIPSVVCGPGSILRAHNSHGGSVCLDVLRSSEQLAMKCVFLRQTPLQEAASTRIEKRPAGI